MAAAAFKGVLKFVGQNGRVIQHNISASDVADEFYQFGSGDGFVQLPMDQNYFLVDLILTAAGTDTSRAEIYANQKLTPEQIQNGANLATNVSRQFAGAAIGFGAGAMLKFKQKA